MRLIFILTLLVTSILTSGISVTGAEATTLIRSVPPASDSPLTDADNKLRHLRGTQDFDHEERAGAPYLAVIMGQERKKAREAQEIIDKVKSRKPLPKWAWAGILAAYLGGEAVLTKVLVDQS
ncbi:hypothetical protein V7S43_011260 [Phytophthora oleae]|uniref:RxLR effector protein n=1 Tax=Phytophthora oleae TaxID=2107226 RepID=A0ABD3FEC3_9STRA